MHIIISLFINQADAFFAIYINNTEFHKSVNIISTVICTSKARSYIIAFNQLRTNSDFPENPNNKK